MEIVLYIVGGLVVGAIIAFILARVMGQGRGGAMDDRGLLMLQQQLQELTRTLDARMTESTKGLHDSVQHQANMSANIIRDVTERLTKLDETSRQIIDFKSQIQSLQDVLKNPKQRGVLGEYYLETLLKNVLSPGGYQMQYSLGIDEKTGKELICDAMVFVKDKKIPVDSKFSLENYNRMVEAIDKTEKDRIEKVFVNDLKNRIIETSKYIQPNKGTTDFAFMFIPHEAIYYDLLVNKVGEIDDENGNLIQRAAGKYKVIIVSPTSFLAYLQTVLQGLRALKIEEQAMEIKKGVADLGRHINSYDEFLKKLGTTLGTTVNHYNSAYKEFKKIDKDVLRVTGTGGEVEALALERPNVVE